MSEGPPSPKRLRLDLDDLGSLSREDLIEKLRELDDHVSYLQAKQRGSLDKDDGDDKEGDDKKQQNQDSSRRENTLVLRLTNKEQELQECMNQIAEMKASQTQNSAQLRSLLLDPAVNLVFQRMAKEMDDCKEKLKQTQNELSAWKFTADSQMGKRLMAKCRMLLQENEELGKMISSGRTSKLEAEIALQKTMVTEMKTNQDEMNEFVSELDEEVEGMQSMIYVLQQQLKEAKENLTTLEAENTRLRTLQSASSINTTTSSASATTTVTTTNNAPTSPVGKPTLAGSSSNSVMTTVDSSDGAAVCMGDNCVPVTAYPQDNDGKEVSAEVPQEVPGNRNVTTPTSESSKVRTTDSTGSPQTPSTAISPTTTATPKIETTQQPSPSQGHGKRTSGGGDDLDSAQQQQHHYQHLQQQSNGRTSAEAVEKSKHNCLLAAPETSDVRADQACDQAPSVPVVTKLQLDDGEMDGPLLGDGDCELDDLDHVKPVVKPDTKPIRNGGLEGVPQIKGECEK